MATIFFMESRHKLYQSDRLEALVDALYANVFASQKSALAARHIVVPCEATKQYVLKNLAQRKETQVVFALQFYTPTEAIVKLCDLNGDRLLSTEELTLRLMLEIKASDDAQLRAYLASGGETRLRSLSLELASLFFDYMRVAKCELLEWLQADGWRQKLWKKLFDGAQYVCSFEAYHPKSDITLHLFHVGAFEKGVAKALSRFKTCAYHLSATQEFVGDLLSDRQRLKLLRNIQDQKMQESFEAMTAGRHPMLTRFGLLLRFVHNQFEAWDAQVFDAYSNDQAKLTSMQFHRMPTRLREVEKLRDYLLKAFEEDDTLLPEDVAVYAPNIGVYEPFIHRVFKEYEKRLPYSIVDLPKESGAIEQFFEIAQARFSRDSIFEWLACNEVRQRAGFSEEEIRLFMRHFEGVTWGWSVEAKRAVFPKGDWSAAGTWEGAIHDLLKAIAVDGSVDLTDAQSIGRFILFIKTLYLDMQPMLLAEERGLKDWLTYLHELAQRYLGREEMSELLRYMGDVANTPLKFSNIRTILLGLYQRGSGGYHTNITNAMHFASLREGASTPKRIIWILGMEEGVYPRSRASRPFQEIKNYIPQVEKERYALLQQMLSARTSFILSYPDLDPDDGKERAPNEFFEEIVRFTSSKVSRHSALSFDPQEFSRSSSIPSQSHADYVAAKQRNGGIVRGYKTQFDWKPSDGPPIEKISLASLRKLATRPIHFYLQEAHSIYAPWEEASDQEFLMPAYERASRRLVNSLDTRAQGVFKGVALADLKDDILEIDAHLRQFGVTREEIKSYYLECGCRVAEGVRLPSLKLACGAQIEGELPLVSNEGLLVAGQANIETMMRALPHFLVYGALELGKPRMLFMKSGEQRDASAWDFQGQLERYINYAAKAKRALSPLAPDWTKFFMKGDRKGFEKVEVDTWLADMECMPPLDLLYDAWKEPLEELLEGLRQWL